MAMLVSSSSAPMAGFCTMTLKTGADRSGNTSRRSSRKDATPSPTPAAINSSETSGREKAARITDAIGPLVSVLMAAAFAPGLLRLRLEEERSLHHDRVAGREAREDLRLSAQVPSASDRACLEGGLGMGHEHAPLVPQPLQRGRRHGEHGRARSYWQPD